MFNMALLAKQGWKIIMQPNCLFARVIKSKYFPKGEFMSARIGSYPPFTWRSIWGTRRLLKEGIGWRIGNGRSVNIWNDTWLLGAGNGRVQCQKIDTRYSKVSDLIERNSITWKQEEMRSLFGKEQMQRIISIPLASSEPQDVLIWRGDNTWTYTAKNGYRRLNITEDPRIQHNPLTKFYTNLWNLKNLKLRKPVINTTCPVCQEEEETVSHLFRDCNFTRQVLRDLGDINATCNRETNWKTWLATEFEHLTEEECKIRTIFLWAIWYNRNRVYHEGRRILVHEVVGSINAHCAEIKHMGEVMKIRIENNSKEWQPPKGDTQHTSVARIIARNKERLVMAPCTYPGENIADPTTTEARACLLVVTMAEEIGFHEIQVEGDALTFKHVPRAANKVAHGLAMEGWKYKDPQYWVEEAPRAVEELVNNDRNRNDCRRNDNDESGSRNDGSIR
ncbi:reverse transcriptase [Gossypium australe]|uniref:Reverse transcriptase n=1 Tax=Gossypium australe TaxID=47621 RepID=A0A5B6U6D6_9ROSI|nr:reverse transcriptase [Gossypium australe]